jgi:hypothetical protein
MGDTTVGVLILPAVTVSNLGAVKRLLSNGYWLMPRIRFSRNYSRQYESPQLEGDEGDPQLPRSDARSAGRDADGDANGRDGGTHHTVTASVEDRSQMDDPLLLGRDILQHYHVDVRKRADEDLEAESDEEETTGE